MNKKIDRNIVLLYKGKQLIFDSQNLPIEIVSVDSAMVYKGMDIGTSKPTKFERKGD